MDSSSVSAEALVDLIFAKLSLTYGREFLGRWEGLDIAEVKADWRRELNGWLLANPAAIRHALENLPPGNAPDVLQFRELCRRRPEPTQLALPGPKADPERVRKEVERLKALRQQLGPRAWAQRLKERDEAGESLTLAQRQMYREALRTDDPSVPSGGFKSVPVEALPPGMRPREESQVPIEAYEDHP